MHAAAVSSRGIACNDVVEQRDFRTKQPDGATCFRIDVHAAGANASNVLRGKTEATRSWDDYREVTVGELNLPPGEVQLTVRSDGQIKGFLFDLRKVTLE